LDLVIAALVVAAVVVELELEHLLSANGN